MPAPLVFKVSAKRTTGGKVVKQPIRAAPSGAVAVSPSSAVAAPGHPAVFRVTKMDAQQAQDAAAGPSSIEFTGRSEDGRSKLVVPVDTDPPIATLLSYSTTQQNSGSGPHGGGDASISSTLADTSGQAFPANCENSTCVLSLWGDFADTTSGSIHYADPGNPNAPSPPCSMTYPPSTIDPGDEGRTNIYLNYDSDGDLVSARLEESPDGAYIGAAPDEFSQPVLDGCGTGLATGIPYPDWIEQPLDPDAIARGQTISESFQKSNSFNDGADQGTVSFNWHQQLSFKIANAGDPPGS
jgi:hypothetical protein